MAFKINPDGSISADSIDEALDLQARLLERRQAAKAQKFAEQSKTAPAAPAAQATTFHMPGLFMQPPLSSEAKAETGARMRASLDRLSAQQFVQQVLSENQRTALRVLRRIGRGTIHQIAEAFPTPMGAQNVGGYMTGIARNLKKAKFKPEELLVVVKLDDGSTMYKAGPLLQGGEMEEVGVKQD